MNALLSHLENNRILSVRQGAALLGVSVSTFRRMRLHGTLPAPIRVGVRRIGWKAADLLNAIEARRLVA